jgi:DNA-binding response OmpR family regulator
MKILVIEDEPSVVSVLRRGLTEAGHEVSVALDGNTGWEMIQSHHADLILLDVMLPGKNGIELLRQVRSNKIAVPVILLTALGMTENVVNGLNNGADDYIVKPFKFDELLARITAVTRRHKNPGIESGQLQIADLIVNIVSKTVTRQGAKINLTATEFKLLEFMLRQQGRVLSRMDLLEHVWSLDFDTNTNVVDVYINYLRKKIDSGHSEKLIHTVVGMGYVLRTE